jgi:hypothetical protein
MRIKVAKTALLSMLCVFFIVTSVSAQNGNPNQNGEQDAPHCRAMGMADGSPHVDPPQNVLDQVQAEYEANCQAGNCFLGEGNYQLLESMGHTREKIDCFLQAGEDQHNQQHNNQNGQQHNDPNGQQHNNQNGQQHNDPNGQQHNNQNGQQHHGTNNQGDQGESACAAIPHPDGSAHVDPPQEQIDAVEAEYAASCQAGACSLSEATYASLESLGHSRGEIDCFLAEGERQHNEEHGGTHPPAGNP